MNYLKTLGMVIYRILQFGCTSIGMCLLILECEDYRKQMIVLGIGLLLFMFGAGSAALESMIDYEREKDDYIR